MPQHVRNFWLIAQVDGRATSIAAGPRAASGGFELVVLIREEGAVAERRLRVVGAATPSGRLQIDAIIDGDPAAGSLTLASRR